MAYALSTTSDRAGQGARVILAATRSIADHQRQMFGHGRAGSARGVCRVQAPAAVNDQPQDTPACRGGFTFLTLQVTCRGFCSGPFSHSNRLPVTPPGLSRSGSVFPPCGQTRTLSARPGSRQTPRQSLTHQHLVRVSADVPDHLNRLSSAFSVGIDPNENGLTHAQKSFAPGAKAND